MFHALYTAASGMTAQQLNLDNIANNLANSSTAGFQARRVQFSDLLYQNEIMPGAAATQQTTVASGLQIGLGTRPGNTEIVQTQGDLSSTGNPLDLAIQGTGFFQILLPNGQTGYTRSGSFQTGCAGEPGDSEWRSLAAGHQHSGCGHQHHHRQRRHRQRYAAGPDAGAAGGRHPVGDVRQSRRLEQHRQQHLSAHHGFGRSGCGHGRRFEGLGTIQQGMLEQSNVNVVDEFVNMILAQRSYESNSRVIKAADEMLQQLNQLAQ